jgi:hypothetical protein
MNVYRPTLTGDTRQESRYEMRTDDYEPRHRAAILYRTHFWDQTVEAEVLKLYIALSDRYDIWVVGYVAPGADLDVPPPIRKLIRTPRDLRVLGLPDQCGCHEHKVALRNLDNVLLYFYRLLPDYEHYWMIEYDVRYTGDWSALLAELDDPGVDLLGTLIHSRRDFPEWPHWRTLCTAAQEIGHERQIKVFTPMVRLTRRAFAAIDLAYRHGWHGHYEALWPTAVAAAGLHIEDIGAIGPFTPAHRHGRHYTGMRDVPDKPKSTFIYRPMKREAELVSDPPMLWHPVKPAELKQWNAGASPTGQ